MKIAHLSMFLLILGSLLAAILGGVNMLTKDVIAENSLKKSQEGLYNTYVNMDYFFEINDDKCDFDEVSLSGSITQIYCAKTEEDGDVEGFVYETSSTNGHGTFTMLTAINNNGDIVGWSVLNANQTPGYGKDLLESGEFKKAILEGIDVSGDVSTGSTATGDSTQATLDQIKTHFKGLGG